jgi:hypothetical protein
MVVPVLITSCHVSLNPNSGPVTAQITMTEAAATNVAGRPVARAVHLVNRVKRERGLVGRIRALSLQRDTGAFLCAESGRFRRWPERP